MKKFKPNLYFSGQSGSDIDNYIISRDAYRLATYAYKKEAPHYLDRANGFEKSVNMMVDSGAFTSWAVGTPVELASLITYNEELIRTYGSTHNFLFIALDVIPGEKGRFATSDEIDKAVEQSVDNFAVMQQHFKGHYVLPVYHSGEDQSLRDYYMSKTDYICLSPNQGMSEANRVQWSKRATDVTGVKFHGLAATGNRMATEIGWESIDSSSWITVSGMGGIFWPVGERFQILPISNDSPNRHDAGHHYMTITEPERANVEAFIVAKGFDPVKMQESYIERRLWNVAMWCDPPWVTRVDHAVDLWS
jgi:hypothetical protein